MKKDDSVINDSANNTQLRQQLAKNFEHLKECFKKIDKNQDDVLTQEELLDFLDENNVKNSGKKFDRNIFKKIFEVLDMDQNGTVSM